MSSTPTGAKKGALGAVVIVGFILVGQWLLRGNQTTPANTGPTPSRASAPASVPTAGPAPIADAESVPARDADIRFGSRQPLPRTPGTIRLATYNVENLYDDRDDPALDDRFERDPGTKPLEHRRAVADVIRRIDADVIALQEVESLDALRWFLDEQGLAGQYPHVVSKDAGDGRGIEQSIISRFPITNIRQWIDATLVGVHPPMEGDRPNPLAGKPMTLHRSPLAADVTVPADRAGGKAYVFTVFTVHCKSGRGSGYWREAEADKHVELVRALESAMPGRNIVVLGDFNARADDASMRTYADAGLADLMADVRRGDPKWQTHASNRIIDHILFNAAMMPEAVIDSRFVLGTPVREPGADWQSTPAPVGYASDHFPVVVDIRPRD